MEALQNIGTTTFNNLNMFFEGKPLVNEICYRCTASDQGDEAKKLRS